MRVKLFGIFENPFHVHNTEVSATTVTLVATASYIIYSEPSGKIQTFYSARIEKR